MSKKDIERLEKNQNWTTLSIFILLACIWVGIICDWIEQPQGTWECTEWEESNIKGHYNKVNTCFFCVMSGDSVFHNEREHTCDDGIAKMWAKKGKCDKVAPYDVNLWIPDEICIKEQFVRDV